MAGEGWGGSIEDCSGVGAKVVDAGTDGGRADEGEAARGLGDLGGRAVGVEGAVEEEEDGHGVACSRILEKLGVR